MYTDTESPAADCVGFKDKMNNFLGWTKNLFHSLAQSFQEIDEFVSDVFEKKMDEISDIFSGANSNGDDDTFEPKYDVISFEDSFYIHIESPGIILDDIQITSTSTNGPVGVNFYISKKQKATVSPHTMIENTRNYGIYRLHLTLPHPIMPNKINVKYNDGVICAVIPKKFDFTLIEERENDPCDDFEIIVEKLSNTE
jgi:HSP20 family molecular chaperone IbpA